MTTRFLTDLRAFEADVRTETERPDLDEDRLNELWVRLDELVNVLNQFSFADPRDYDFLVVRLLSNRERLRDAIRDAQDFSDEEGERWAERDENNQVIRRI